ncbi:MAG TPA: glutathione S-transferase [Paracoccaceae bacterium]|nr:glutathione S-transferase [Paracoccaceae bacterium]
MMTLYHSPLSPYVRKVMVVAHETGLLDEIETLNGSGTPLEPNEETVAQNPLGKIPALVTEDGMTLFDSRVICRYLDKLAGAGLYPSGSAEFPMLAREALAEGIIDAALLVAYEGRLRPENLRYRPWVDGQKDKVRRGIEAFERHIDALAGHLTMDKIALGCALGYVDFRLPELNWREGSPGLAAWYREFSMRQSMKDTAVKQPVPA